MRRTRIINTGLGALAALAITPAVASAAGPFTDDTAADFGIGTTGASTWIVEPGAVQLKPTSASLNFDGSALPDGWAATQWDATGTATVSGGALTVNGTRVTDTAAAPTGIAPETLEFRGTFAAAPFEHVGFGNTFEDGPWAMFSTGGGTLSTGLYARTMPAAGGTSVDTPITDVDVGVAHVYRIEWGGSDVKFYVDGRLVATNTGAIAGPMRPVISDFSSADAGFSVDWLGLSPDPASATYDSRVLDAASVHAVWGTLTATDSKPSGSDVAYATRTGNTATPDASWSAYEPVGAGGAIQSPPGQYLQYRATLSSSDATHTPSIDKVQIAYDVDETAPLATVDGVAVDGTSATVTFSSGAADVARFECSLDGGAFAACTSPSRLTGLAPGSHTIAVRAVDKAANTGNAASAGFTVQAPTTGGGTTGGGTTGGGTTGGGTSGGGTTGGGTAHSDHRAPVMRVSRKSVRVTRHGAFAMKLHCPGSETRCTATVRIRYSGAVVAHRKVSLAGGTHRTVTLRLARDARRALARRGHLRVRATIVAQDAAGNVATRSGRIRLLAARR